MNDFTNCDHRLKYLIIKFRLNTLLIFLHIPVDSQQEEETNAKYPSNRTSFNLFSSINTEPSRLRVVGEATKHFRGQKRKPGFLRLKKPSREDAISIYDGDDPKSLCCTSNDCPDRCEGALEYFVRNRVLPILNVTICCYYNPKFFIHLEIET